MIPPVSVRGKRPCDQCVFCNSDCDYGNSCNLNVDAFYLKDGCDNVLDRPEKYRDAIASYTYPCKYHHTDDELKELLDAFYGYI